MRQWISACAAAVLISTGVVEAGQPIVLMPLGDSITAGTDGGYRKPLVRLLSAHENVRVTTCGSQTDKTLPPAVQPHEGHPGWRLDQLTDNLLGDNEVDPGAHGGHWLKGGEGTHRGPMHPTVVTLSAGINDINQMIGNDANSPMSGRVDQIEDTLHKREEALVSTLTDNLPDTTILLGGCIPYNNGLLDSKLTGATDDNRANWAKADGVSPMQELGVNHYVILFNKWIRDTYVPDLQKQGKKVYYVDVYSKFILPNGEVRGWNNKEPQNTHGPDGYADFGLHPNQFGYAQMADAWAAAIHEHPAK